MTDDTDLAPVSFGTDGWRATLDIFTDARVRAVGQAVADYLRNEGEPGGEVIVGYDARRTSEGFATSLADVLTGNGFDATLPERDIPTPLVAYAVVDRGAAGALMVTASHNPPEYNGVKFIPADGAPALPEVTQEIEANLRPPDPTASNPGTFSRVDLISRHASGCRDLVRGNLDGLTVAYDAIHGSGRGVTDELLAAAGADVIRLRCDRNTDFGGVSPEPAPENLTELTGLVRDGPADIGVANDGDADRLAIVTPERGPLDANLLFAATYDALLEGSLVASDPGPAVRTVSTTFLIDRIARAKGQEAIETAVGFKWVAAAMREHDALMGGEESGGFAVRGHVREKDGVFGALLASVLHADEGYDARVDRLEREYGRIVADKTSLDCPDAEKSRVIQELGEQIPDRLAGRDVDDVVTVDGFKLLLTDGSWLLVRPSGTEPKMRVYAEAGDEERVKAILTDGAELVADLLD